jgi:hypothetical protein
MKQLTIPLGYPKALHSHSAKSPKYGDISRWLTVAKWLVISQTRRLMENRRAAYSMYASKIFRRQRRMATAFGF